MRTPNPSAPESSTAQATSERPSRRSFVFFGAAAAAALLPKPARAQAKAHRKREVAEPAEGEFAIMRPNETVAAFAEWESTLGRLVRRVTYGPTVAETTKATQLGFQGYLNYQLNYTRINDDAVETAVASKWPLLAQSSDVLFSSDAGQVRAQLQEATIYRAAFSQARLEAPRLERGLRRRDEQRMRRIHHCKRCRVHATGHVHDERHAKRAADRRLQQRCRIRRRHIDRVWPRRSIQLAHEVRRARRRWAGSRRLCGQRRGHRRDRDRQCRDAPSHFSLISSSFLLVHDAALHHEAHALELVNVRQRIAAHRDQVREPARLHRPYLVRPSEKIRRVDSRGLDRLHRR